MKCQALVETGEKLSLQTSPHCEHSTPSKQHLYVLPGAQYSSHIHNGSKI